jgi:hypothetical protein
MTREERVMEGNDGGRVEELGVAKARLKTSCSAAGSKRPRQRGQFSLANFPLA